MKAIKILRWSAWATCVLVGIMLSFKMLREPDLWWQILTGEWIVKNGGVVRADPFSYTFEGVEWINVKWLFEVVAYFFTKIGGPEFVYLLQTGVNILLVVFLFKLTKSFKAAFQKPTILPTAGIIIATFFALFASEFRLIGRPEMTSHLLTLVYVAIFMRHRVKPDKGIYWLIPLQIIWTNAHEAYGIGLIIMAGMIVAQFIEKWYIKIFEKRKMPLPKHLLYACLGGLVAISLNPRGPKMILHPFEIFSQVGENKYTQELYSWETSYYWQQKEPYLMLFLFAVGLLVLLLPPAIKLRKQFSRPIVNFGFGYVGLFFAFFYLGLTAHRNIPFFILLASPLLAIVIDRLLSKIKATPTRSKIGYGFLLVFGLSFYAAIGSNKYYDWFNEKDRYGLREFAVKNPCGAIKFIEEKGIKGTCFSDYLISSYPLWKLRPEFKSYIDLRDLDVFTNEFFQQFAELVYFPEQKFPQEDQKYNFDYVLLYRPQFAPMHKYLFHSNNWSMVYADPMAVIFLKNNEQNKTLIEQYGISKENPDVFTDPYFPVPNGIATVFATLFWPPYNKMDEGEYDYDALAANYYMQIGYYEIAAQRAIEATQNNIDNYLGFEQLGFVYLENAVVDTNPNSRLELMQKAQQAFNSGVQLDRNRDNCFLGLAQVEMQQGQWLNAVGLLKQAEKVNDENNTTYILLAECQAQLSNAFPEQAAVYQKNWVRYLEKAYVINSDDELIRLRIGTGYCNLGNCEKASEYLKGFEGTYGMTQQDQTLLKQCKQRCGIE